MAKITDQMVYLVVVAHSGGDYLPEQNVAEMDRKTVVRDIANAQYEGVIQVLECNPVEGICRDCTDDIMDAVCELWADEGEPVQDWQYSIIEQTRGTVAANAFQRSAA